MQIFFFSSMIFIVDIIIFYKVLKNRKNYYLKPHDYINLNNRKTKAIDKRIIMILCASFILNLLNIWVGEFIIGWFALWFPIFLIYIPDIYINNEFVGTLWKCVKTEGIDFLELSKLENSIEIRFKYKDRTEKRCKYRLNTISSILNNNKELNELASILRKHGYEVHIDTLK
ncbi:hypothetical protein QJR26_18960 (plasmid) [Clostridium baratii]